MPIATVFTFVARFEAFTWAGLLVGMQMLGLPADYPKTRNDKVNAVSMDDVKRVAARLLKPENLFFMVVGEPVGLTATE